MSESDSSDYGLEYFDPEAKQFLENGRIADLDENISLVEDRTLGFMVSFEDSSEDYVSRFEEMLEEEGYETGEELGWESYSVNLDREGLEMVVSEPYVSKVECARRYHLY